MKTIKTLFTLVIFSLITSSVWAQKIDLGQWNEDYAGTLKEAAKSGKPVMLDFTGSDWCGWCIKIKKEIFDTAEFKQFAKDNLYMVELDFPRQKTQSAEVKEQNEKLSAEYGVEGFPTLIILNSKGEKVGEMGYVEGGPQPFIDELKKVLAAVK